MPQEKNIRVRIFSEKLASLMLERGFNQKRLAELSGGTQASISRYLNGQQEPRLSELVEIAHALGVTIDELCTNQRSRNEQPNEWRLKYQETEQKLDALKDAISAILKKF